MKLILKNWKGLTIEVDLSKQVTKIQGQNMSGKTRIADAFFWLFTGKDRLNRQDHNIKTFGETKQEHLVSLVNGENIFTRIFKEKWVKNRKTREEEFKGHETMFIIGEKEVKKKDYETAVAAHVRDIDIFKVINNPSLIGELHWKKLRDIIIQLSDVEFNPADFDFDTLEKQRKALDKELDKILVQIETLENSMIGVEKLPGNFSELIEKVQNILDDLNKKKIARLTEVSKSEEILKLKDEKIEKISAIIVDKQKAGLVFTESSRLKLELENSIRDLNNRIEKLKKENDSARSEYTEISKKEIKSNCYACGQVLPSEKIEKVKNERAEKLKQIQTDGKTRNEFIQKHISEIEGKSKKLTETEAAINKAEANIKDFDSAIEKIKAEYETKIGAVNSDNQVDTSDIDKAISEANKELSELKEKQIKHNAHKDNLDRIEKLKKDQAEKGKKYASLSEKIDKIQAEFKKILQTIESVVNFKFKNVSFKLFEEQINGEIKEVCTPMIDNCPYSSFSNAQSINAGIEIAEVISEITSIEAPVFVDNAEAVNELYIPGRLKVVQFLVTNDEKIKIN